MYNKFEEKSYQQCQFGRQVFRKYLLYVDMAGSLRSFIQTVLRLPATFLVVTVKS